MFCSCKQETLSLPTSDLLKRLEVDEFELTGEITPVIKKVNGSDVARTGLYIWYLSSVWPLVAGEIWDVEGPNAGIP